ncbi:GHKL domain-containing protein [Vagococcus sp. BWB3-3]|uniref:GHKL domain-containing protein n=1 Tax=Vagococcus allomyrinae TaxID=2794353 RepID=A0A940PG47_9ENTE|nr:GHKL domain-containing protein [Vagococcus allomyrinae]MBP1042248.1 GHKL domain-containing protein [Vagococcus allomyrinae]
MENGRRLENIFFFSVIVLIVCPILWKASNLSFIRVMSVCLLLTGLQIPITVIANIISNAVTNLTNTSDLASASTLQLSIVLLSNYVFQVILSLLLNLFLRSGRGQRTITHLFQTKRMSGLTFGYSIVLASVMVVYVDILYEIVVTEYLSIVTLLGIYVVFGLIFGLSLAISSYIRLYQDKLKAAEAMLIQQQSYNRVLEDIQQDIRHFQHDYKNILSSFYLQLKEGRVEEAQALLEEKFLSFDQNVSYNIKQMHFLNNIQQMEIKSLLLTKMLQMEQKNIKFQVEVMDSISEFHIETEDLVRCLGILLDNAMEEETLTEEKTVHFVAYRDDSTVTIMIKNHLQEEKKIAEITQEGYSTKGDNRGIGLSSYQKILNKYPNVLNKTVVSDNQFQQVLKMQIS